MSSRRTKKQKKKAKHQFTISWDPSVENARSKAKTNLITSSVKGQTQTIKNGKNGNIKKSKYTNHTAEYVNLGSIKHNLAKSLIVSSLILSLEVVLYLVWQ